MMSDQLVVENGGCPFKKAKLHETDSVHNAAHILNDEPAPSTNSTTVNRSELEDRLREFQVLDEIQGDISGTENEEGNHPLYLIFNRNMYLI